jgi:hypothetical protein
VLLREKLSADKLHHQTISGRGVTYSNRDSQPFHAGPKSPIAVDKLVFLFDRQTGFVALRASFALSDLHLAL